MECHITQHHMTWSLILRYNPHSMSPPLFSDFFLKETCQKLNMVFINEQWSLPQMKQD